MKLLLKQHTIDVNRIDLRDEKTIFDNTFYGYKCKC